MALIENFVGGSGSTGITLTLFGSEQIQDAFEELSARTQNKILKSALQWAADAIVEIEKGEAPRDSGLLSEALGSSALRKFSSALFITAGVRWGFRRRIVREGRGRRFLQDQEATMAKAWTFADPGRYVGVLSAGRTNYRPVAGNPFMTRAADKAASSVAAGLLQIVADGIAAEAAKLIH